MTRLLLRASAACALSMGLFSFGTAGAAEDPFPPGRMVDYRWSAALGFPSEATEVDLDDIAWDRSLRNEALYLDVTVYRHYSPKVARRTFDRRREDLRRFRGAKHHVFADQAESREYAELSGPAERPLLEHLDGDYLLDEFTYGFHVAYHRQQPFDARAAAEQCRELRKMTADAARFWRMHLHGEEETESPEFRIRFEPVGLPEGNIYNFAENFTQRLPLGVEILLEQRDFDQPLDGSRGRPFRGVADANLQLLIGGRLGWYYHRYRGWLPVLRWPVPIDQVVRDNGETAPIRTDADGRAFVDLRHAVGTDAEGDRIVSAIDLKGLAQAFWDQPATGKDNLRRLEIDIQAIASEVDADGGRMELARTKRPFCITHVAELLGTGEPVDDSIGVEVYSRRHSPKNQKLWPWRVYCNPRRRAQLLHSRPDLPAVLQLPLQRTLPEPLALLPEDVLRIGRLDSARLRFLFDNPGDTWLLRANPEVLDETGRDHAEFCIFPAANPPGKSNRGAMASFGVGTGTSVILAAVETGTFPGMVLAVVCGVAGELAGALAEEGRPSVQWIRIDQLRSTLAVDVSSDSARLYLVEGQAKLVHLESQRQVELKTGELLHVDRGGSLATQTFRPAQLPDHLRQGIDQLADRPENRFTLDWSWQLDGGSGEQALGESSTGQLTRPEPVQEESGGEPSQLTEAAARNTLKRLGAKLEQAGGRIVSVDLTDCPVGDEDLRLLAPLTDLQKLHLDGTQITGPGLERLQGLQKLQLLSLRWTAVNDDAARHIARLSSLTTLLLNDTKMEDAGIAALKPLKKLSGLHLDNMRITARGITELAALPALTFLSLAGESIGSDEIAALAKLPSLRYLILLNAKVSDANLPALTRFDKLNSLNLWGTQISSQGAARLRNALPKTRVYHLIAD